MAGQQQGGGGGGGPGGMQNPFGAMCDCSNMPPVTKALLVTTLVGGIAGSLGVAQYTANIPLAIVESGGVQFYRLLTAQLFGMSILSEVFSVLMICQLCRQLEQQKGSIFTLYSAIMIGIITNLVWFIVIVIIAYGGGVMDMASWPLAGSMPLTMGLMAIEQKYYTLPTRRLMCCPCDVPSQYYPFAVLALFGVMTMGSGLPMMIAGLMAGYLYTYVTCLHLSAARTRRMEASSTCDILVNLSGFIGVDNASVLDFQQPGGAGGNAGAWANNGGNDRAAPLRSAMDANGDAQRGEGQASRAAIFASGGGHRLGGNDNAYVAPQRPVAAPAAPSRAVAAAAGGGRPGAVLADRMAAAAAARAAANNSQRRATATTMDNNNGTTKTAAPLPTPVIATLPVATLVDDDGMVPATATAAIRYTTASSLSSSSSSTPSSTSSASLSVTAATSDDSKAYEPSGHVDTSGSNRNGGYSSIGDHDDDDDDGVELSGARPLLPRSN